MVSLLYRKNRGGETCKTAVGSWVVSNFYRLKLVFIRKRREDRDGREPVLHALSKLFVHSGFSCLFLSGGVRRQVFLIV